MSAARAIAVAAVVLAASAVGFAELPEWSYPVLVEGTRVPPSPTGATVLLSETSLTSRPGGREVVERRVVRVETVRGVDAAEISLVIGGDAELGEVSIAVRDPAGRITPLRREDAYTQTDDDESLFERWRVVTFRSPRVVAGSMVVADVHVSESNARPQTVIRLGGDHPVHRARVRVSITPEGSRTVYARTSGLPAPDPSSTTRSATWEFRDLPAFDSLHAAPALALDEAPANAANPFADWSAVARWAAAYFDPTPAGPAFERATHELAEGNVLERAIELARRVRYHGLWEGYRPRPPEATLSAGMGDCKDKAALLIALLRHAGIAAFPVLVRTRDAGPLDEALPGLQFNHAIVGIPVKDDAPATTILSLPGIGRVRLVDATVPEKDDADTVGLEGLRALPLHAGSTGLATIVAPRLANGRTIVERWTVDPTRAVDVRFEVRSRGALEPSLDVEAARPLVERATEWLHGVMAPQREGLERLVVERAVHDDGELVVAGGCRFAGASESASGTLPLGEFAPLTFVPLPAEARSLPLAMTIEERLEIDPGPHGVAALPRAIDVASPAGHVSVAAAREGDRVVITRALTIVPVAASAEDVKPLRDALRSANAATLRVGVAR